MGTEIRLMNKQRVVCAGGVGRGLMGQGLGGHRKWLWKAKEGACEMKAASLSHKLNENTQQCIAASSKFGAALTVA